MKKLIILFILFPQFVFAGEIHGSITTNYPISKSSSGGGVYIPKEKLLDTKNEQAKVIDDVKVKGVSYYLDNTLLRCGEKIYRIENQMRRYIKNLEELAMYRGQEITDVDANEIRKFKLKEHSEEALIRCSDMRIYVLQKGFRKHILNLQELRQNYPGEKIFDVDCFVVWGYVELGGVG